MAKNKNNKAQNNNKFNAEFAEEFNQNNAAGKAANQQTQKAEK
ncbi:hypothetical protein SAMN05216378_2575 [Paenibacillus catalpae]|uniref:Uncharacterized protein n=1 Tax=Paenibacillus catalpae TaxID=1045775 RepID=A0A1I1YG90_9BACL|nr:hypothetical protein [Paenibacillus catalpae]SFE16980.1 hypothetical protein SAMN05216378_2575 [Paenibacillus catalpae]